VGVVSVLVKRLGETLSTTLDDNLLFLVTHLYSISTGKPPVEKILNPGGASGVGYNGYSGVLRRVVMLARDYGLGYVDSIRSSLNYARNPFFRDFLLRFSEALSSGHDLEGFLEVELDSLLSDYKAVYTRLLETIRALLGIYVGVLSSVMFLNVNVALIAYLMFGSIWPALATMITSQAALWFLAIFMYYSLPKHKLEHSLQVKPRDLSLVSKILLASLAIGMIGGVLVFGITGSLGLSLIALGTPLIVPGYMALRIERRLRHIASFLPIFAKNYGALYSTLGNEVLVLKGLLRVNIGPLNSFLRGVYARLTAGVDRRSAWFLLAGETGSEVVRRTVDIMYDSLESAADMRKVGERLGDVIADYVNMQKSREQVARSFQVIVYLLHVVLVALAQFIVTLIQVLGELLGVAKNLPVNVIPFAGASEIAPGVAYIAVMTLSMAMANAIVFKAVEGGYWGVIVLHLGILMLLSGVTIIASSTLSDILLRTFIEGITIPQFPDLALIIVTLGGFR
jgi:flagellar protein FlaJ